MLFIVYAVIAYWAAGVVIYENKVIIHTFGTYFIQRLCYGIFFGIILIPVAIIKRLLSNR